MTKGQLMQLNYTADEIKQIDVALPLNIINDLRNKGEDTYFYVINYNNNALGTLEKMVDQQKKTNLIKVNGYNYYVDGNELISCSPHMDDCEVQVSDLTDLKVWEYNELVNKIKKHYPEFKMNRLEGRFV